MSSCSSICTDIAAISCGALDRPSSRRPQWHILSARPLSRIFHPYWLRDYWLLGCSCGAGLSSRSGGRRTRIPSSGPNDFGIVCIFAFWPQGTSSSTRCGSIRYARSRASNAMDPRKRRTAHRGGVECAVTRAAASLWRHVGPIFTEFYAA